ncbi:DUF6688 family protein [Epilithonimonas zeae]|uniref:Uncharacterized protein n=1 Tax=Epilithonimonas zeae TaxID=1416779 RepID=A0A1N6EZ63_9FLAO|nr:DUF6688 family protein [Epilithonimonas zeae]SIN88271.1 hypothetical protein SAMN05444409_0942 [Epilithonimonas zeae]
MSEIVFCVFWILFLVFNFFAVKAMVNKKKIWGEIVLFFIYILSLLFFAFGLMFHTQDYHTAIDPVDECYSPIGGKHIISLLLYFFLYHISAYVLWIKSRKSPPLFLVFCLIFIYIGIIINFALLLQFSIHNTESLSIYKGNDGSFFFVPATLISNIIGILLLNKIISEEKNQAENRSFKSVFLNRCNLFLSQKYEVHIWAIFFLLPVFFLITLILILFGQDYNSMVKVFTDTTTWAFSQKTHPPILDHKGHYLCTVSAKGNPKLVKPTHIGKRHGQPIIVNRQLQIANAFEELIADWSPKIHQFVRSNYDKYGYNLSIKINNQKASDVTYVLMKPLEWFFLFCLYLFCEKPEAKIKKQYL